MIKTQNYVTGRWVEGKGEGVPMFDAISGEVIALSDTSGLDFGEILHYGREKGRLLRSMTFQERGNMLKKLAFYLIKKKQSFYDLSYRTGATKVDSWIDIEGGFGNLFDRLYYGSVIDFIDLNYKNFHWFIFNVADMFITTGIIILIVLEFFKKND